ncbi:MAG: hypothetical protein IT388_02555 [Nitrospirales bacterium]|nr:hypothetical protein [Nitrospirales bacterium]
MIETVAKNVVIYPGQKRELRKRREGVNGRKDARIAVGRKPCPFTQDPYDNCFCAKMLSQNIEAAIHYCGSHYKQCEIYKKWA